MNTKKNLKYLKGGFMKKRLKIGLMFIIINIGQIAYAQPNKNQPIPTGQQVMPVLRPQVAQAAPSPAAQVPDDSSLFPMDKIPVSDTIKIPVLDFKNVDVRDVLRGLGMQYKLNIFLDPEVTGQVTLYLTNVSVRSAIDFIAKRSGCAYTIENGIMKIYKYKAPPAPLPPKPPIVFHLANGLLNIDVKKLSVQEVAQLFADSASINVMVDGSAEGEITARLASVKIDKAVRAIFEPNGFTVTVADGIHYVSKTTPFSSGTGTGAAMGGNAGGPQAPFVQCQGRPRKP